MKIIETQIEHGAYLLTLETSTSGKKSFTVQLQDGGEVVIGNTYEEDVNMSTLKECLELVTKFFNEEQL